MSIHDLRQEHGSPEFEADLCIVGTGPAGLSIALQFADSPVRVCIVESGGLEKDAHAEALNEIESVGLRRAPQDVTRCRGLGGTSALWSGRCGVFDAIDYQHRPWLPFSGWPIGHDDVAPYFDRAGRMLGLGPALYSDHPSAAWLHQRGDELPWDAQSLLPVVWQFSQHGAATASPARDFAQEGVEGAEHIGVLQHAGAPRPKHFGEAFLPLLQRSRNIQVLLHANVTCVETDETASRAQSVAVSTLSGKKGRVRAPRIVLACGGVDNARLLLASTSVDPRGVGNAHDMVGRFLTDHPFAEIAAYDGPGSEIFRRRLGQRWFDRHGSRHAYSLGVRLSPELQRREHLLNCALHLVEFGDQPSPIGQAGRALRSLRQKQLGKAFVSDLTGALRHPVGLATGAYERYVLRQPSLQTPTRVAFGCVVEQKPDPDSRVLLSEERDALGMRRAKIDWRASDLEFETAKRMTDIMLAEMSRLGYKPPKVAPWLSEGPQAFRELIHDMAHPMSATRMSASPSTGVVDANCQVHGVSGLYVAGSSVFSTAGYMNPTLMIVSLSLRLADHLKSEVSKSTPQVQAHPAEVPIPTPRRARVAIVGAGDRVCKIYLPIFKSLEDEFELVGFTTRSSEKASRFSEETAIPAFPDAASMAAQSKPDFMLVAVSSDVIDGTLQGLVELNVPLLLETPFTWNAARGRKTLKRIQQLELLVGVAEQTPFLPAEQFKRQLIDLGLLGRVVAAQNDFAVYDYHGIGALRAYLGSGRQPVRVNAVRSELPAAGTDAGKAAPHARKESWVQASVTYDDGTSLIHHYSSEYFDSPLRSPRSLRVYGTSGSIVDDTLLLESTDGPVQPQAIQRQMQDGRLQALVAQTPLGEVRWCNPFAAHRLSDEQIAVATLLSRMKTAVLFGGVPAYTAASGLEDMELLAAMRFSWLRHGKPVQMPLKPRFELVRSVAIPRILERLGRITQRLIRRRKLR
jgi:choline dehydrogenase-like flavoprotein/predicted dehydrogenase